MLCPIILKTQLRCLCTTNISYGQGRMMQKILSKPKKQRKFITNDQPIMSTNSLGAITGEGKKNSNSRRINVLNKLFMRHITDLMSTGTYSNAFTGHGIEINRVKVAPDFRHVNVYWLARSNNLVENIADVLKSHASALRHELTNLHVLGTVPKIEFVKDDQYILLKLLDEKLAQADYGEDHKPADTVSRLKKGLELETSLETQLKYKIQQLDEKHFEDVSIQEDIPDVPDMPQNVLGLNHADIMQRILINIQKSKGLHRKPPDTCQKNSLPNEVNHDPVSFPSMRLQREAFRQFLNKQQLMKQKVHDDKVMLSRPELDYYEDEWYKKRENDLKKYDFHEYLADETDYIHEDDDDYEKL